MGLGERGAACCCCRGIAGAGIGSLLRQAFKKKKKKSTEELNLLALFVSPALVIFIFFFKLEQCGPEARGPAASSTPRKGVCWGLRGPGSHSPPCSPLFLCGFHQRLLISLPWPLIAFFRPGARSWGMEGGTQAITWLGKPPHTDFCSPSSFPWQPRAGGAPCSAPRTSWSCLLSLHRSVSGACCRRSQKSPPKPWESSASLLSFPCPACPAHTASYL